MLWTSGAGDRFPFREGGRTLVRRNGRRVPGPSSLLWLTIVRPDSDAIRRKLSRAEGLRDLSDRRSEDGGAAVQDRDWSDPPWPIIVMQNAGGYSRGGHWPRPTLAQYRANEPRQTRRVKYRSGTLRKLAQYLASRGFICVLADYSLARARESYGYDNLNVTQRQEMKDSRQFPAQVRDLDAAMRWVAAEATPNGHLADGDPAAIGLLGSSAGTTIVQLLAATRDDAVVKGATEEGAADEGQAEDGEAEDGEAEEAEPKSRLDLSELQGQPDSNLMSPAGRERLSGINYNVAFMILASCVDPDLVTQHGVSSDFYRGRGDSERQFGRDIRKNSENFGLVWFVSGEQGEPTPAGDDELSIAYRDASAASYLRWMRENGKRLAPPTLILHADGDTLARPAGATALHNALASTVPEDIGDAIPYLGRRGNTPNRRGTVSGTRNNTLVLYARGKHGTPTKGSVRNISGSLITRFLIRNGFADGDTLPVGP